MNYPTSHINFYLLLCFCISCTNNNPPSTFSPGSPEQEIKLTGQIINYDETKHPGTIEMTINDFALETGHQPVDFLDSTGRFEFTLENNIAQDYILKYGNGFKGILLQPGDSVHMMITIVEPVNDSDLADTGNEAILYTDPLLDLQWKSSSRIVNQSMDIVERMMEYDPEMRFYAKMWPGQDLDSLQNYMKEYEKGLFHHMDSVYRTDEDLDPVVMDWMQQLTYYQYKSAILTKYLMLEREFSPEEKDSLYQILDMENWDLKESDSPVYHTMYQHFIRNYSFALKSKSIEVSLDRNRTGEFQGLLDYHIQAVKDHFDGFEEEFLLAQCFDWWLNDPKKWQLAEPYIDTFLTTSGNYHLTRIVGERYANLLNPDSVKDVSEKMLEIPIGIDNILPEILESNKGKVIVMDFWATWCGPCLGHFKENGYPGFIPKFKEDPVVFVFLAKKSPVNLWQKMISEMKFTGQHILLNREQEAVMDKLFGITAIPQVVVLDQEGNIIPQNATGPDRMLERTIRSLL